MMNKIVACLLSVWCCLSACQPNTETTPSTATTAPQKTARPVDSWSGKWKGVEGTYLELMTKDHHNFQITIADLDGPKQYEGTANEGGTAIRFVRNNVTESIQAGDGKDTGMKWLAKETNCVYIKTGEGFCRE